MEYSSNGNEVLWHNLVATRDYVLEVKENNSSAGEWPSTYSLQQKADDGLYRLTTITFKLSFFPIIVVTICYIWSIAVSCGKDLFMHV